MGKTFNHMRRPAWAQSRDNVRQDLALHFAKVEAAEREEGFQDLETRAFDKARAMIDERGQ